MAKFVVISAVESESEPESLSEEEGDSELEEDEEEELELGDEPESGSAARVRTFRSWSDPASATMQPPSRLLSWWRCKSAISPTSMVQFCEATFGWCCCCNGSRNVRLSRCFYLGELRFSRRALHHRVKCVAYIIEGVFGHGRQGLEN